MTMKLVGPVIFLFFALLFGCSKTDEESRYVAKFEPTDFIGKENGKEDEIIGLLGGLAADHWGNVYVADNAFKRIKKFSGTGELLLAFGKGEGKGPGEFLNIRGLDIDSKGNIFVGDMNKRDISIFDSSGVFIGEIKTILKPAILLGFSPAKVFVSGFKASYQGDIVHEYRLGQEGQSEPALTFGIRYSGPNQWEIEHVGEPDIICKGPEGGIFLSWYFPYKIWKYNAQDSLEFILSREVPFFKPPYLKDKATRYVIPQAGSKNLAMLNDSILVNLINEIDEGENIIRLYFDFWNVRTQKFLCTFDGRKLDDGTTTFIASDAKGSLFIYYHKPFPRIVRFKVTVSLTPQ